MIYLERVSKDQRPTSQTRPVIGLIGGIGAGKSTVAMLLKEEGCFIVHSDDIAHEALEDRNVRATILTHFGESVLAGDGSFDRSKLAQRIFESASLRATLEGILHPWIETERRRRTASMPSTSRAVVIDAPLLLEVGLDKECDAVLFVDAPEAVRRARVIGNRGWSAAQFSVRQAAQMSLDQKRARASAVLVNAEDGASALAGLHLKVRAFLEQVIEKFESDRT